ncbi:hypothetical protein Fmac_020333 [Flemingia macrophylla]|uniref:Activator of Hsp90 ATPase AHSA1-like N-terminal domain-containing protein n=1 Tax=Flemingia macrophylla TaxID=520843 RepID=A0ABD1LTP8_9FABA
MAKFGEGDKRWIVADRPDGTNVHNWHWAETNCLHWSKAFFQAHLTNAAVTTAVTVTKLESLDGEAYVNVRKGKVIPGYELTLRLAWEGLAAGSKVSGSVVIPYLSDENAAEDPDLTVTVREDGDVASELKAVMATEGKALILEKVRVWVAAMAKGGPVKDDLEAKKSAMTRGGGAAAARNGNGCGDERKSVGEGKKRKGCKMISLTERFRCRAMDLFEIMMDEDRWKGFTQSDAKISKEVGGEFSIFNGSVTGTNLELHQGKFIVQRWRFGTWPDGMQSTVRIVFEEPEAGVTVVKLTHSDLPEEDRYGNATVVENTERGWREHIFQRIRTVFNFGI